MSRRRSGADRRRVRGAQRGQVLILVAILVPALIAMVGVVTDTSMIWIGRRGLQNAADAAALAGAQDLPNNATADAKAREYALENIRDEDEASVTIEVNIPPTRGPHQGKANHIEVIITSPAPLIFAGYFGVSPFPIYALAVAEKEEGFGGIFAMKDTCGGDPGIDWSGSSATVEGSVHSNSEIKVGGSDNTVNGSTTYVCDNNNEFKEGDNDYNPAPAQTSSKPPPLSYSVSDFPCTFGSPSTSKIELKTATVADGVYCAKEVIVSGQNVTGTVTLVAHGTGGKVILSGSGANLTPYLHGVLAFSQGTGSDAIKMEGSNNSWTGIFYAPVGRADMSGSSGSSVTGGILAWTIKLPGSVWGVAVGEDGGGKVRLVE